ncbi:N-acetylmuramoyl-L-alanine amidase [Clostridium sp.]|jgi:hypothetical protein|uniref:N-acetylmuramoyl-L-alanine amidase n=1 Tax=Clostridium sp. TaxID=1506 RepID=UPI003EEC3F71
MDKTFGSIGHGGKDSGATSGRFIEKNMNLIYGKACMGELSKYIETKMSRIDDRFISLSGLVSMSNNYNAQIHLAFHLNAGGGDGCEIYHSIHSTEGKKLAESISKKISALGQNAHGQYVKVRQGTKDVKRDYYTELGSTKAIAVILEPAFLDSKDVEFVDTEAELKILGIEVAHGVLDYLSINVKQEAPKVVVKPFIVPANNLIPPIGPNITLLSGGGWIEHAADGRIITHQSRSIYTAITADGHLDFTVNGVCTRIK